MKPYLSNAFHHLHTIDKHRFLVFIHCVRAGIPLQGLTHDLSKYSPAEFLIGVRYFQGDHSPNVEERREKGYSTAWLHHKGRNRHHFEYWFDNCAATGRLEPVKMPTRYVIEMFCDRVAASKVYKGNTYTDRTPLDYFLTHDYSHIMHPETETLLKKLLEILAEQGESAAFAYIRTLKK